MKFDPLDFLIISKELQNGKSEAHFRSLINRAYYAAFGHIRNNLSISSEGLSIHWEVISMLMNSKSIEQKKAGKKLELLFRTRKECDYKHHIVIRPDQCGYCIKEAEQIIALFNQSQLPI